MPEYEYVRDRREDLRSFFLSRPFPLPRQSKVFYICQISYIIKLAGHRPAGSRKRNRSAWECGRKESYGSLYT